MPAQLWETTMNPETRLLKQLVVEDAAEANVVFSSLMGSKACLSILNVVLRQTWYISFYNYGGLVAVHLCPLFCKWLDFIAHLLYANYRWMLESNLYNIQRAWSTLSNWIYECVCSKPCKNTNHSIWDGLNTLYPFIAQRGAAV